MMTYLTSDLPGSGGAIKEHPEDFLVTEIPAYEPCGSGDHTYLTIEKRGIPTLEAIRRVSRELEVPEREIGYAGLKDSDGITRQMISVPKIAPDRVQERRMDGVSILAAVRHTNKLKLGHLKGNRFRILIRSVSADALTVAGLVMERLLEKGVPNWFGYQRYGSQGNTHRIGAAMLRRDWKGAVDRLIGEPDAVRDQRWQQAISSYKNGDLAGALALMPHHCRSERDLLQRLVSRPDSWEKAFMAVHPRLKKLYLSAYQSSLFDRVVERRLERLDSLLPGDLAWKHVNGACFLVEDADGEAARAATFEISASGPMYGSRMKWPEGEARRMEAEILEGEGLSLQSFDLGNGLRLDGERRPLRVPLGDPLLSMEPEGLLLQFSLPKGSYATSVIREITKTF